MKLAGGRRLAVGLGAVAALRRRRPRRCQSRPARGRDRAVREGVRAAGWARSPLQRDLLPRLPQLTRGRRDGARRARDGAPHRAIDGRRVRPADRPRRPRGPRPLGGRAGPALPPGARHPGRGERHVGPQCSGAVRGRGDRRHPRPRDPGRRRPARGRRARATQPRAGRGRDGSVSAGSAGRRTRRPSRSSSPRPSATSWGSPVRSPRPMSSRPGRPAPDDAAATRRLPRSTGRSSRR